MIQLVQRQTTFHVTELATRLKKTSRKFRVNTFKPCNLYRREIHTKNKILGCFSI